MLHDNNKVVSNIIVNSWVNVLIKHPILDNVIVITASKNIDQITRHGSRHSPTKFWCWGNLAGHLLEYIADERRSRMEVCLYNYFLVFYIFTSENKWKLLAHSKRWWRWKRRREHCPSPPTPSPAVIFLFTVSLRRPHDLNAWTGVTHKRFRGVARIFQKVGHRGYSPDCHVDLHGLICTIAVWRPRWRPILTEDNSRWRKYFTKKQI